MASSTEISPLMKGCSALLISARASSEAGMRHQMMEPLRNSLAWYMLLFFTSSSSQTARRVGRIE